MAPCQTICIHMDPPKEIKFQRPTFNRKTLYLPRLHPDAFLATHVLPVAPWVGHFALPDSPKKSWPHQLPLAPPPAALEQPGPRGWRWAKFAWPPDWSGPKAMGWKPRLLAFPARPRRQSPRRLLVSKLPSLGAPAGCGAPIWEESAAEHSADEQEIPGSSSPSQRLPCQGRPRWAATVGWAELVQFWKASRSQLDMNPW